MYARVAKWEGVDADAMRQSAERLNAGGDSGPPEGVPAKAFMMLTDPENGRNMAIVLFETEEDMATGDATLNQMNPPEEGAGQRVSVEMYEVAVDLKAP
jgi:hypothetical protein